MQPVAHRMRTVIHLGIEADRPGQHKDDVADHIGIAVLARAGQQKPDRQQRDPDREIEPDQCAHGPPGAIAAATSLVRPPARLSEAPICWVMPPASPAATSVSRNASSSEVLPWST